MSRVGSGTAPRASLWLVAAMAAIAVAVILGLPLLGQQTFSAVDNLENFPPWSQVEPDGIVAVNPLVGDTIDVVIPAKITARERVASGDLLPLRDPLLLGGVPLLTGMQGFFSPLNLPFWLTPGWYAPGLSKALEIAASMGLMWLLLRRLGVGRVGALLGGLIYTFTAFQIVWTNWPQTHVGALIPGLVWSGLAITQTKQIRYGFALALLLAVAWIEGFPVVAAYGLIIAAALGALELVRARDGKWLAGGLIAAGAVVLGTGLAALQLVPFMESLGDVSLVHRDVYATAHLPLRTMGTSAIPDLFGSPMDRNYYGPSNYVEMQAFLGIAAMSLALIGAAAGNSIVRRRYVVFFSALVLIAGWLIWFGGPALELFQSLPFIGTSFIGRLRPAVALGVAVLAAIGFDVIQRQTKTTLVNRALVGVGWLAAAAVVGFAGYRGYEMAGAAGQLDHFWSVIRVAAFVALVVAALVAVWGIAPQSKAAAWAAIGLAAIVTVEAVMFSSPYLPRVEPELFYPVTGAHQAVLDDLGDQRLVTTNITLYAGTTVAYGIRTANGHAFHVQPWKEMLLAADDQAFSRSPTFSILAPRREVAESTVLDRLAVAQIATDPRDGIFGDLVPGQGDDVVVLQPGSTFERFLPGGFGRIRGAALRLAEGFDPGPAPDALNGDVVPARGEPSEVFRRVVTPLDEWLWMGIPDVDASDGGTIRFEWKGDTPIAVQAADGEPVVSWVRTSDDDPLSLKYAGGAVIYDRRNALPRIRWASHVETIPEGAARVAALAGGVDHNTVIASRAVPPPSGELAILDVQEDSGDLIVITVDAAGAGYLVVMDTIVDTFTATVDGERVEILEADHAGGMMLIPAGTHTVELNYTPQGLGTGVAISAASALSLAAVGVGSWRRRGATRTERMERQTESLGANPSFDPSRYRAEENE